MKKQYIAPTMYAIEIENAVIYMASRANNGGGDNNNFSKGNIWSDDDEILETPGGYGNLWED